MNLSGGSEKMTALRSVHPRLNLCVDSPVRVRHRSATASFGRGITSLSVCVASASVQLPRQSAAASIGRWHLSTCGFRPPLHRRIESRRPATWMLTFRIMGRAIFSRTPPFLGCNCHDEFFQRIAIVTARNQREKGPCQCLSRDERHLRIIPRRSLQRIRGPM
jgi:hypothetical protein